MPVPSLGHCCFPRLPVVDWFCLLIFEFWLSLCKIARRSVILLLPIFTWKVYSVFTNIRMILPLLHCVIVMYLSSPPSFQWGSYYLIFSFIWMFCRSLFVLLYCVCWSLHCLFFSDIRILITPVVSSNSSVYYHRVTFGLTIFWTFIL